jgi:plastocyanin
MKRLALKAPSSFKQKFKNKKVVLGIVVVLVAAASIALWYTGSRSADQFSNSSKPEQAVIQITGSGFSPAVIKIKLGTKVVWTNDDSQPHTVNSNPHPEHNELTELNSPLIAPRDSYSHTFDYNGTFGYHDEKHLTRTGTIIVE